MIRRHPNKEQLSAWLNGEGGDFDDHLETCERCAQRIEELADPSPSLRQALIDLLTPPEDLDVALRSRFDERSRSRADLSLIGDLLALPVHVSRSMSRPTTEDSSNA